MLLVLDNFEQVIDASPAIGELLSGAPGCAAIVTSRERLGISGEQEYPVPPLSPDGAIELFTARARQVKPGFEPGKEVGAICERLDQLRLRSSSQPRASSSSPGSSSCRDSSSASRCSLGAAATSLPVRARCGRRSLGVTTSSA